MKYNNIIEIEYNDYINGKSIKKVFELEKNLIKEDYSESSLFVSKVEGESMQPLIKDNAFVIADLSKKEFINEDIFLIFKENKMWIKKAFILNEEELFVSINPKFSHLKYKKEDYRIIAKVLLFFNDA
ncbi:S24 family peptidase [Arcobacter aquimarinus]|uniref:S24 family peptidase n=1 Tax=Arcobacter aquimarinus TaxID=1315211 RepID=UPI003BAEBA28